MTNTEQAPTTVIRDVTINTFLKDVIEESQQRLVLVYLWAAWCDPCKKLTPALEKLVAAYKGAMHLAKVDADANPQIAQQLQVNSFPAVFAFFRGQPVDGFLGALPEAQLKKWLDRLVRAIGFVDEETNEMEEHLKRGEVFYTEGDIAQAQEAYADALAHDPANAAATAGLLRCLIALKDIDQAQSMLEKLPADLVKDKAFDPVRAALELAAQSKEASGSLRELSEKVEKKPDDHQARFDLALAYYAAGQRENAVDSLLEIVSRDRKWNDEAARKQLLKFFEAFGFTDPLTVSTRQRLSSILFS